MGRITSAISVGSVQYLLLGLFLLIIGLCSLGFGAKDSIESYSFDKNGLQLTGTVIRHTTSRGSKGRIHHHALTQFKLPSGEKYEQTFSENLSEGNTIAALFLKDNQGRWSAKEASFEALYMPGIIFSLLGLLAAGAGTGMIVQYAVRIKEIDELNKFGKFVKAKVSGISVHKTKNSCYSIVHASSEENLKGVGSSFVFDSEPVSGTVSRVIVGSEVEILINRQDASMYLFEIR